MSTTINLVIDTPDAILTFHEPDSVTLPNTVLPNTTVQCVVGHYANQGNVPQTVAFVDLTDLTNCAFVSYRWTLPDGTQVQDGSFTLEVDNQALLEVWVHTATEPIGEPNVNASFTVNVSHEQTV